MVPKNSSKEMQTQKYANHIQMCNKTYCCVLKARYTLPYTFWRQGNVLMWLQGESRHKELYRYHIKSFLLCLSGRSNKRGIENVWRVLRIRGVLSQQRFLFFSISMLECMEFQNQASSSTLLTLLILGNPPWHETHVREGPIMSLVPRSQAIGTMG